MELISEYINHIEINQVLSFNSLRLYKRDLVDFDSFCKKYYSEQFDYKTLDSELLNRFSAYIHQQGRSTATVNRKLTAVHGFWIWMREKGLVSRDPFTQIKRDPQYRNKTITCLSEDEIVMLLDHSSHDLKTKMVLELIYATGIRVGELTKLTVSDINLETQMITIPRSSRFKERVIPFNQILASYMKKHIQICELTKESKLLLNRRGEPVSEREIFRIIREAARAAGLNKPVSPSILRNSFLKHMKENGAHDTLLRDITGQKTVNA